MQTYRKRFIGLDINELYDILKLRFDVFVLEQECLYQEIDNLDQDAIHVYIKDGDEILAYFRVLDRGVESEDVAIGRVIAKNRRQGLGTLVLKEGIKGAKEFFDADAIYLEAQSYAKEFYEN
ncbi:GNAT family N-acetyltransferase [Anaerococcus provencensis]|uniref:GNAT family N-acetyltransferase n=1 Tax=Anaerococcus provencensis TaxID=938293 RepID=UPI0002D263E2|nr:GNAT family N-acetyltransferase [Anaerococcus provencensis]